jgi:hypothetical protein
MGTLIYSKNEYIILLSKPELEHNINAYHKKKLIVLNKLYPMLDNIYPIHLGDSYANDDDDIYKAKFSIIDMDGYLHIIRKTKYDIDITFWLYKFDMSIENKIYFPNNNKLEESLHLFVYNKIYHNVYVVYFYNKLKRELITMKLYMKMRKNDFCEVYGVKYYSNKIMNNVNEPFILGESLFCTRNNNILVCIQTDDYGDNNVYSYGKMRKNHIKNIKAKCYNNIYYTNNMNVYKRKYTTDFDKKKLNYTTDFDKKKLNYADEYCVMDNDVILYKINDKYYKSFVKTMMVVYQNAPNIFTAFCEVNNNSPNIFTAFCGVDNKGYMSMLTDNCNINIGFVGFIYAIKQIKNRLIVISPHNCYLIKFNISGHIITKKIQYGFDISMCNNMSFYNKFKHEMYILLPMYVKMCIKMFILCNKNMGILKIPYWITYDIFNYMVT